jgi:hypothetical protein
MRPERRMSFWPSMTLPAWFSQITLGEMETIIVSNHTCFRESAGMDIEDADVSYGFFAI